MSTKYRVSVAPFAEKHYIKTFQKKYKDRWSPTWISIIRQIEEYEKLADSNTFSCINECDGLKICKMEFRIAGKGPSRKRSGNRAIILFDTNTGSAKILLMYHKQDFVKGGGSETAQWKKVVTDNFPECRDMLK